MANMLLTATIVAVLVSPRVWAKDDTAPTKPREGYVIYKMDELRRYQGPLAGAAVQAY